MQHFTPTGPAKLYQIISCMEVHGEACMRHAPMIPDVFHGMSEGWLKVADKNFL